MDALILAGGRLHHAEPGRSLAAEAAAPVKGENDFVSAVFIQFGMFSTAGGIYFRIESAGYLRPYRGMLGSELGIGIDRGKGIGIKHLLIFLFHGPTQARNKVTGLVALMGDVNDQVFMIVYGFVMFIQIKGKSGHQVGNRTFAVKA